MVPAERKEKAMRNYLANTLFAGVSLALTASIVAFSSSPVSASVPANNTPHAIALPAPTTQNAAL